MKSKSVESELKIDQKLLHVAYRNWPEHFQRANKIDCYIDRDPSYYNVVVFCGMGGSATACDIMNDIIQFAGKIPCFVARGQTLPPVVDERSLVLVCSVSGNTTEALKMAKEASDRKAEIICISSGGDLRDFAISEGIKYVNIPNLCLPRASLPYLIMPCLKAATPFIPGFDHGKMFSELNAVLIQESKKISVEIPEEINRAKAIASFLNLGFTFCFTSPFLLSVGTRFKNSLNENAKLHCYKDSILESAHNEIVPFTYMGNASPRRVVLLSWKSDPQFVQERFAKVKNLFAEIGQPWHELVSNDGDLLIAILRLIYILDYATIYMALKKGLDPSPTPAIDILKKL